MFVLSGGMKILASAANVRLCPLTKQHSLRRLDDPARHFLAIIAQICVNQPLSESATSRPERCGGMPAGATRVRVGSRGTTDDRRTQPLRCVATGERQRREGRSVIMATRYGRVALGVLIVALALATRPGPAMAGDHAPLSRTGGGMIGDPAAADALMQAVQLTATDTAVYDSFGWAVAVSKDGATAVIGAPGTLENSTKRGRRMSSRAAARRGPSSRN